MHSVGQVIKLLSFSLTGAALIGLLLLQRIDWIVHKILYDYGLSFSYDWAVPYWFIMRSSMLSLWVIATVAFILPFILWRAERRHAHEKRLVLTEAKGTFSHEKNIIVLTLFLSAGFLGIASIVLNSDALVLAALGLVIWGTILLLATTQKVVKVNMANLPLANSAVAFDSLLSRFGYDGMAVVNPPMSLGDNPSLQILRTAGNGERTSFTPLGLDLAFLIEKKSPIDLFMLEFDTLAEFLSKMFTDELELASGFVMLRNDGLIQVKIKDFIFQDLCKQIENSSPSSCKRLLCPICSSLACVISKATQRSVSLDRKLFNSSNTIDIFFRTHEAKLA